MSEYNIRNIRNFSDGLAAFQNEKDNLWGFINEKGKVIIKPMYTDIKKDFENGVCAVEYSKIIDNYRIHPKYFFINKDNKRVSKLYTNIGVFNDGLAVAIRSKMFSNYPVYGYVNSKGEEVIPCKYRYAYKYMDGKCKVVNDKKLNYFIIYNSEQTSKKVNDEIKVDNEMYASLCKKYKYVIPIDNYFIVSNEESFDDIYGGIALGLVNNFGEEVFPMQAYDIKKVGNDIFFIDKISEKILLNTKKMDFDTLIPSNFMYERRYKRENNLLTELSNDKDFAIIINKNIDSITDNYYLAKKDNLKVRVIPADILVYNKNVGHIYEEAKCILKYLDLSNVKFDGIDITNTNFLGSNAKINPQTIYNKDLSGVIISATNIIYDDLEPNYNDVITDENTNIIGEYLSYNNEKKLTLKNYRK